MQPVGSGTLSAVKGGPFSERVQVRGAKGKPMKKESSPEWGARGKCRMVPQSILWRTPPKGGAYAASVSLLTAFRKENIAEALPEGRSQHLGGVAEKPSEAYPSFSLDGEPPTIRSYSGFSDVGKAFVIV